MKGQIFGNPETIQRVRDAKPGDPHIYVNMEAINELPEQFEVHIEKVSFDVKKDFVDVGNGNWMPTPQLMNDIAEKRGIDGTSEIQIVPLIENIDINPLLCNPLGADPIMRKMILGKRVVKTGRVLTEDGTYRTSDPIGVDFNVWERCSIEWSKEEEWTNGYDPAIKSTNINGNVFYKCFFKGEATTYFPKYDTKFKRKRHFDEAMKFAQRNADTKARNVVIRVLAGLKTGYKLDELKDGYFIFPKIRRSREILKLETAADLQARSKGLTGHGDEAGLKLFGEIESEELAITEVIETVQVPVPVHTETLEEEKTIEPEIESRDNRGHIIAVLKGYQGDSFIIPELTATVSNLLKWLEETVDAEANVVYWKKALSILQQVDNAIPEGMRVTHKLY